MKYLISACLLGVPCRWHGKKTNISKTIKSILQEALDKPLETKIIPICPEILGGLSTPRPPVKSVKGRLFETSPNKAERKSTTGAERTNEFLIGAQKTLEIASKEKPDLCIFCKFSPSCDKNGKAGKLLISNGFQVLNIF